MKPIKQTELWRFGWHFLFVAILLVALASTIAVNIFQNTVFFLPAAILVLLAILVAFFAMLLLAYENVKSIKANSEKLDSLTEMTARNKSLLTQITQGVLLSDAVKTIAF